MRPFRLLLAGAALVPLEAAANSTLEHRGLPDTLATLNSPHDALSLLQVSSGGPKVKLAGLKHSGWAHMGLKHSGWDHTQPETSIQGVDAPPAKQRVVWIKAFPRSGSSTLLTLLSHVTFPVFALFEPCAKDDKYDLYDYELEYFRCGDVLNQLVHCNFSRIMKLTGWHNGHSIHEGVRWYTPEAASEACRKAGLVIYKTVNWGHNMALETLPFVNANPEVRVVELLRDPRSIYVSMSQASGFDVKLREDEGRLIELCDQMAGTLDGTHKRIFRVFYEDLARKPHETAKDIFDFMEIPPELGQPNATGFVDASFNAKHCEDKGEFSDCKANSTEPIERRRALPYQLKRVFREYKNCRRLSLWYGYY